MLIGYVSDERYSALSDVVLEFVDDHGQSWEARSRATGAVHLDLPAGSYTVTLQRAGYGAKRSRASVPASSPHQFRLLADGLSGYVWPKWVRGGEAREFRVHAVRGRRVGSEVSRAGVYGQGGRGPNGRDPILLRHGTDRLPGRLS
jgi:N,N-dimethylformamidase